MNVYRRLKRLSQDLDDILSDIEREHQVHSDAQLSLELDLGVGPLVGAGVAEPEKQKEGENT